MKLQEIKDTYNQIGDHFSKTRARVWPETRKYIGKLDDGDSVLDLGCGNGRLLTGIKAHVKYTGLDFSQTLIKQARKLHPSEDFILADLTKEKTWENLPRFNAIFSIAALHHIPHKEQHLFIISQAKKHLKEDGFLFLTVWNLFKFNRLEHHLKHGSIKLKLKNWRWINTLFQHKWLMFCFAFDVKYLRQLLKEAGFNQVEIFYSDKKGKKTSGLKGRNLCAFAWV